MSPFNSDDTAVASSCWHVKPGVSVESMIQEFDENKDAIIRGLAVKRSRENNNASVAYWWTERKWIPFLQAIKGRKDISKLYLHHIDINPDALSVLVSLFTERTWKRVELCNCVFEGGSWLSSSLLTAMARSVESLGFRVRARNNNNGRYHVDDCLRTIGTVVLNVTTKLRSLSCDLEKYQGTLAPDAMTCIANGIRSNKTLVYIDISGFRLVLPQQHPITAIIANENPVVTAFATAITRTEAPVETIRLVRCGLRCQQAEDLFAAFQSLPNLKYINFASMPCQGCGFLNLAPVLSNNLLGLNLSGLATAENGNIDIAFLMECLKTSDSIKKLALGANRFDDNHAKQIVSMLLVNKSVESLLLGQNAITNQGAMHFADHFSRMPGLKYLYLQNNLINVDGAKGLLERMKRVTKIAWLGLLSEESNNNDMKHIQEQINHYCMLNAGGRKLLDEAINPALWPYVLARVNRKHWWKPFKVKLDLQKSSREMLHYFADHAIPLLSQQQQQQGNLRRKRRLDDDTTFPVADDAKQSNLQKKKRMS